MQPVQCTRAKKAAARASIIIVTGSGIVTVDPLLAT